MYKTCCICAALKAAEILVLLHVIIRGHASGLGRLGGAHCLRNTLLVTTTIPKSNPTWFSTIMSTLQPNSGAQGFLLLTINGVEVLLDGSASQSTSSADVVRGLLSVECITLQDTNARAEGNSRDVFLVLRIDTHGTYAISYASEEFIGF